MNARDAEGLLGGAIPRRRGVWADFGAGTGTFTRALAHRLDAESRVYAVDRDPDALASLASGDWSNGVELITMVADFTRPLGLPDLRPAGLDGMLFANSLHFVAKPEIALARLLPWLRHDGSVVIVEYDGRRPSRWVPHPISGGRLADIAAAAGLTPPAITATRPSAYGGSLYVAVTKPLS